MGEMTRAQQGVILFLSLLLSLVFLLTHSSFFLPKGSAPFQEISFPEKSPQGMITIEVDGSVHQRGTYTVQSGVTVLEAVEKAGGVTEKISFPPEDLHRPLQQMEKAALKSSRWHPPNSGSWESL
jgi:hypothetical protein